MALRCDLKDCPRFACEVSDPNGVVTTSLYCKRHTCGYIDETGRGYYLCPKPKRGSQRFCKPHFEILMCSFEGCEKYITKPREKRYRCPDHSVRCEENGCNGYVKFAGSKYCEHHQQCIAGGCSEKQFAELDSSYCQKHTCTIEKCSYQARENRRCSDHKKCTTPDCEKVCKSLTGQDSLADYCEAHFNTCQICGIEINRDFKFCMADRCKLPGCKDACTRDSRYCKQHLCARTGCAEKGVMYLDQSDRFCVDHECQVVECDRERRQGGKFCSDKHACQVESCNEKRVEDESIKTGYCLTHDRAVVSYQAREEARKKAELHIEDARAQEAATNKRNAELQAALDKVKKQYKALLNENEALRREAQRKGDEERIRETRKPHMFKSRTMPASPTLSSSDEGYRSDDREPTTWGPGFQFTPRPDSGRNRHSGFYARYE